MYITKEMRSELKIANREIRENKKKIKSIGHLIAKTLDKLMSEDSPCPDFRDKCLAYTRRYAEQYVCGIITKKEMKDKYREFQGAMVLFALKIIFDDPRFETVRDTMANYTYHSIRRDAILNGETVSVCE